MKKDIREIAEDFGVSVCDTTSERSGYPKNLSLALTDFETITELEKCAEELKENGYDVTIVELHKRDGWSIWNRVNISFARKGMYCSANNNESTVTINPTDNVREMAEFVILGNNKEMLEEATSEEAKDALIEMVDEFESEVKRFMEANPNQKLTVFYEPDQMYRVNRILTDESTGFYDDTHHYKLGIEVSFEEEDV